ncbi:hypothetical protein ACWKSP_27880 [Micromonosporaceae bacterium Da 78-11]
MMDKDGEDLGVWSEFGTAAGFAAAGAFKPPAEGLGDAPGEVGSGLGDAPDLDGLPPVPGSGAGLGVAAEYVTAAVPAPAGYHNKVDADGDGNDDKSTYRGDGRGGVEILVDLNGDGRTDFIGHDTDLDNRVDFADYDKNHDGVFEKTMYDDDGNGLLDRTVWLPDS